MKEPTWQLLKCFSSFFFCIAGETACTDIANKLLINWTEYKYPQRDDFLNGFVVQEGSAVLVSWVYVVDALSSNPVNCWYQERERAKGIDLVMSRATQMNRSNRVKKPVNLNHKSLLVASATYVPFLASPTSVPLMSEVSHLMSARHA